MNFAQFHVVNEKWDSNTQYLSYIPNPFRGKFYSKYIGHVTYTIIFRVKFLECSLRIWMSSQNLIKIYSFDTFAFKMNVVELCDSLSYEAIIQVRKISFLYLNSY